MTSSKLPANSLPIAALMLSHRHDTRLDRALASVEWAQQILVLNTNPQSGTPWQLYTKKYSQLQVVPAQSLSTDFAAWRNQLLEHVTQPWVFFIDSDEVAIVTNPTEFAHLINTTPHRYSLRRVDYFLGKPLRFGEVGNVWLNRLGPAQQMRFRRVVHEVTDQTGPKTTSLLLHHHSHLSISEFISKISVYATLEGESRSPQPSFLNLYWQTIVFPVAKFVLNFWIRFGFLDGWRGLVYATMMSLHSFMVRVSWYEKHHRRAV